MWKWTLKKPESWRIDAFKLCCWRKLKNPLDSKEIKPVNPKRNQSWIIIGRTDAEALILRPPDAKSRLTGKDPDAGKDWEQVERATEDEMFGWHHRFNGPEFEQTLGNSEGQGNLGCCSSWGHGESDRTDRMNDNNDFNGYFLKNQVSPSMHFSTNIYFWVS